MRKVLSGMLGVLLCAAMASAQAVMTVTKGVLQAGQQIEITYSDPNRKGDTIVVEVDDGTPGNPIIVLLYIHLDGQGKGSTPWITPNWWGAAFNAPGVGQITRIIDGPDDGG